MVTLYYKKYHASSKQALRWFREKNIEICAKEIQSLSRQDLFTLLRLSSGFEEVLKKTFFINRASYEQFEKMTFDAALDFLLQHTDLFRLPIILDENKFLVGYNADEIKSFLPHIYRKQKKCLAKL